MYRNTCIPIPTFKLHYMLFTTNSTLNLCTCMILNEMFKFSRYFTQLRKPCSDAAYLLPKHFLSNHTDSSGAPTHQALKSHNKGQHTLKNHFCFSRVKLHSHALRNRKSMQHFPKHSDSPVVKTLLWLWV